MKITSKACEISFELDHSVEVRGEDGLMEANLITFQQPTRKTAPLFQNLVSMFTRSFTESLNKMSGISPEALEQAQELVNEENIRIQNEALNDGAPKDIQEETIEEEVENTLALMTTLDFDFEKGFALFDRIILSGGVRSKTCSIGGVPLTEAILDRVNYRDYYKMLAVYLSFFGKPAKSDTPNDSSRPSESATPVVEV